MYNRLQSIPACDGQTDILPRHSPRYAYASRGNKLITLFLQIILFVQQQQFHVQERQVEMFKTLFINFRRKTMH